MLDLYELAWRPAAALVRRSDPMTAHARTVALMRLADTAPLAGRLARLAKGMAFPERPERVGGVDLPFPVIVAAGLVKGDGFDAEDDALEAVRAGRDIVPGWRSAAALMGPVEFGSYTRYPRQGNHGRVLWRDDDSDWMQNRVGLRNPGARAVAAFLSRHAADLPPLWGLNLAVSPGLTDPARSRLEVTQAAESFATAFAGTEAGPSWLTLNLSCPNTEDDPRGNQSADLARELCGALVAISSVPVWVKIGPDLSDDQLAGLVDAFGRTGVQAVVATNTWARPVPGGGATAGISGSRLRPKALHTVRRLEAAIAASGLTLDVIGGGGVLGGADWRAFRSAGARAVMVYSALVFRGPLAGALILREAETGGVGA